MEMEGLAPQSCKIKQWCPMGHPALVPSAASSLSGSTEPFLLTAEPIGAVLSLRSPCAELSMSPWVP